METWLILNTYSLANNIKSQPSKSYLRNILCLLVIYCKINMLQDFCQKAENATIISILLRNLAVDSSSVLETEVKNFQINCGQLFLRSILNFINVIINSHPSLTEWIFAIPMIHLLMGQHNNLNTVGWNENPSNLKYAQLAHNLCYIISIFSDMNGEMIGNQLTRKSKDLFTYVYTLVITVGSNNPQTCKHFCKVSHA